MGEADDPKLGPLELAEVDGKNVRVFPCVHRADLKSIDYIYRVPTGETEARPFGIAYCSEACAEAMDPRNRETGELEDLPLLATYEQALGW